MIDVHSLPSVNAGLNAASLLLLLVGYGFIRARRIAAHRACMVSAFVCSALFLVSYLVYHAQVGTVRFPGTGAVRTAYLVLLASHTVLAATVPVLAIVTLRRALRGDFVRHRAIARFTWPIWVYVSATGIVVYVMLYRLHWQP